MRIIFIPMLLMLIMVACQAQTPKAEKTEPPVNPAVSLPEPSAPDNTPAQSAPQKPNTTPKQAESPKPLVTFIELGSVSCIPCKQMQPVMKEIEAKYAGIVKVEFFDVWKDKSAGQKYGIKLIPTQVFLDASGKEFSRHEGFFSTAEISKLIDGHLKTPAK
jgi:thioredoxin 1